MAPDHAADCVASVVNNFDIVACIVSVLDTPQDRLSASLVCKMWKNAVIARLQRVAIRSRVLLHRILQRFVDVRELDFSHCCDELDDSDFMNVAPFLCRFERILLGSPDNPQNRVSDDAVIALAVHCPVLKHIQLASFSNVTDRSIIVLAERCRQLQTIFLEDCVNLGNAALKAISRCRHLQKLTLKGKSRFTSQGLAVIGEKCSALRAVCFELQNIDVGFALKSISRGCPLISKCSLKVGSVSLGHLAKCTTLTCFRVETDLWNHLEEAVVAIAASNKDLEELTIVSRDEPLSEAAVVRIIQSCPLLVKLHIDAARLAGMGLQCLMGCKSLKSLYLDHFKSPSQGLADVGVCALDLKCLSLRSGRGFHDVELQMLVQGCQWLELLDLEGCHGLSPTGFSAISQCKNLQSLNLSFTQVNDLSLMTISNGIKCLKRLSLVKCACISDLEIIARFSSLEALNLDQCPFVNDEGLDSIAFCCSQLTHVSLACTQISDKGLFYLMQCSQLQSLRVPYCSNIVGDGLVALSKACVWLQFVVLSHRFRGTKILEEMNKQFCMARLEADDMALVPFGFNLLI